MSRPCGQRRALASRRGRHGQDGLAAQAAGVDRAEGGGGEGGEHARVRGDRLGDAFASGQARADELAGVPLVHRRAGRANSLAAVAARGGRRAVEGSQFAGGQVDHVGAAVELDRVRAAAVGGELAFPAAEVRACWSRWCRRRSPPIPSRRWFGTESGCRGSHDAWPQRCWAAWRVMPSREPISAQEYPNPRRPVDGLADRSIDLLGEAGQGDERVDVAVSDTAGVGPQDAPGEPGVVVVLDQPPRPFGCQGPVDGVLAGRAGRW